MDKYDVYIQPEELSEPEDMSEFLPVLFEEF